MFNAEANKKAVPVRATNLPLAMTNSEKHYYYILYIRSLRKNGLLKTQSLNPNVVCNNKMPFMGIMIVTVADDLNL